jgi:DNA gyrase, B subunit
VKFIGELFRSCVLNDIKDSAGGSAKQGRDPATQAIIPIRGKIINVEKEDLQKVLKNEEVKSIINAIGAGFLDTFDVNKMRYGKVIIATDSDIDGYHIRTLLTTFFFRFMPALIEAGKLYSANPPLYRIIQGKNIYYCRTDKDKDDKVNELNKKGISNYEITRFKGLTKTSPKKQQCFGQIHLIAGRTSGYQCVA